MNRTPRDPIPAVQVEVNSGSTIRYKDAYENDYVRDAEVNLTINIVGPLPEQAFGGGNAEDIGKWVEITLNAYLARHGYISNG